jgi:hypothetical protein
MTIHIMHGRPISSKSVVVKVTRIRQGHEFKDLDYPNEEEGIENLKDAKRNFIIWSRKDIILKTSSSLIISPQNREHEGTPTSQNTLCNTAIFTPPSQNSPQTTPPPKNPQTTSWASFSTTCCYFKVLSSHYPSSSKSTTYTTSWVSFSTTPVSSSYYHSSPKFTNWTSSSASFSTTCWCFKVSSTHYPPPHNPPHTHTSWASFSTM